MKLFDLKTERSFSSEQTLAEPSASPRVQNHFSMTTVLEDYFDDMRVRLIGHFIRYELENPAPKPSVCHHKHLRKTHWGHTVKDRKVEHYVSANKSAEDFMEFGKIWILYYQWTKVAKSGFYFYHIHKLKIIITYVIKALWSWFITMSLQITRIMGHTRDTVMLWVLVSDSNIGSCTGMKQKVCRRWGWDEAWLTHRPVKQSSFRNRTQ